MSLPSGVRGMSAQPRRQSDAEVPDSALSAVGAWRTTMEGIEIRVSGCELDLGCREIYDRGLAILEVDGDRPSETLLVENLDHAREGEFLFSERLEDDELLLGHHLFEVDRVCRPPG